MILLVKLFFDCLFAAIKKINAYNNGYPVKKAISSSCCRYAKKLLSIKYNNCLRD